MSRFNGIYAALFASALCLTAPVATIAKTAQAESVARFIQLDGAQNFRDAGGYRAMLRDFLRVLTEGGEPLMTLARAEHSLSLIREAYVTGGVTTAASLVVNGPPDRAA